MPNVQNCPICKGPIRAEDQQAPFRPFCSPRCKTIDLGSWLSGNYRVSRPLAEEELDQGLGGDGASPISGSDPDPTDDMN